MPEANFGIGTTIKRMIVTISMGYLGVRNSCKAHSRISQVDNTTSAITSENNNSSTCDEIETYPGSRVTNERWCSTMLIDKISEEQLNDLNQPSEPACREQVVEASIRPDPRDLQIISQACGVWAGPNDFQIRGVIEGSRVSIPIPAYRLLSAPPTRPNLGGDFLPDHRRRAAGETAILASQLGLEVKSPGYHIAALSHFFGPLVGVDMEIQRAVLRMATRVGPSTRHRSKASSENIKQIIKWALQDGSKTSLKAATLILLAFSACLRVSELCHLHFSDLTFQGNAIWWLFIRRSKTDQMGQGATVAFRWDCLSQELWNTKHGVMPSRDYVARQIKKTLASTGLAHRRFTPYSFRGGAATQAVRKGADSRNVMLAGRWKSFKSFQAYIDPSPV
ncbi:site-specific recombinase, phage integrase family [Ancylostoma duodenale]|uniref:Site-specific recombinase, phage integrase family n=1 Tax=Ancylostoma duodenale TaxID=51022 RepID=A0A0C2H4B1_9BILA|nr:site-specific recombinase, phage integrase family [Ancylostoma duodenale]